MEHLYWTIWFYAMVIAIVVGVVAAALELIRWRRFVYDIEVDGETFEKVRYEVDHKRKQITIRSALDGLVTVLPYVRYSQIARYTMKKEKE